MSSSSKSPTMEPVQESHPHLKAFVSQVNTSTGSPSPNQLQQVQHEADRTEASLTRTQDAIVAPSVGAEVDHNQIPDEEEELNDFNNNMGRQQQDAFLNSFPPGYRFNPRDDELVLYYLQKKILNEPLPPNKIMEVNLYRNNPETLAERYETYGEKEWYFFTPRDRKYPNGHRPNRAAGGGYWKATGADKTIWSGKVQVGCRKTLVFYRGKPPKGTKTSWIMHEYRVPDSRTTTKRTGNDMRLDNWVLCRIYKKAPSKNNKTLSSNHEPDHVEESISTSLPDDMEMEMNGQVDDTKAPGSEEEHPHNIVHQPYGFDNSCPNYVYTYSTYSSGQSMFPALNNNMFYDHRRFQPVPLSSRKSYANMLQMQQTYGSSSPILYPDQNFSLQFADQKLGVQFEDQRFIVHPVEITSESMLCTEEASDQKCVVHIPNQKLVMQSVDGITSGSTVCTYKVYSDQKCGMQFPGQNLIVQPHDGKPHSMTHSHGKKVQAIDAIDSRPPSVPSPDQNSIQQEISKSLLPPPFGQGGRQYIEESEDDIDDHNFFNDPTFAQLGSLWP